MTQPNPKPIVDLIEAFRASKAMFTAVSLGVFDRLHGRPASAGQLAAEFNLNAGGLERLLDACAALDLLLRKDGVDGVYENTVYENTAEADLYLRRESPETLAGYILYSDTVLFKMWDNLDGAVREGSHRWTQTFGLEGPIFSHFFKTPEAMRAFIGGMHGFGLISSPAVVRAFDLSAFRRLADLGGATGHLAKAAADLYPNLAAAVFDIPRVAETAREYLAGSRVEVIAGDFFTDPLPPADLYTLGRILHDWNPAKIALLLARIYVALPESGALLIAEKLLDDEPGRGPVSAALQSLNMLVCTEGQERTPNQYAALLGEAGFSRVEFARTGSTLDAILARK